ncbi:hypothetical protein BH20ACT17_BH20ACT17_16510 [soil metagenome]
MLEHPRRPEDRAPVGTTPNAHVLAGARIQREVALDRIPLVVLLDQLVELVKRPAVGNGTPALGERLTVVSVLVAQRAIDTTELASLAGDAGVDIANAFHPARTNAALEVGLDRTLRLTRATGQRLALARRLVEVLADDALNGRALLLVEKVAVLVHGRQQMFPDGARAYAEHVSLPPFANEPVLELRRVAARTQLTDALAGLDLPLHVPIWIGEQRRDGEQLVSTDPGDPQRVVALAARATEEEAAAAVASARRGFAQWSAVPAAERTAALRRAAAWMRERRAELAALALRETAKPWADADADVCEAIDFLEFYARGALELDAGPALLQAPGERNELHYVPRGVCAVIAPWNFPLAIPMGMAAAALATGNSVVLKPAEQAPGCGLRVVEALRAGGVPADAIALLPGDGGAGAALAQHPDVATIAFTGSGAVGLQLLRTAAQLGPGARQLKRVVAEMGGKNCVIVDSDADLDEAVPAIVESGFGYAGQKCSAAARVLVHESIHDVLVQRLAGAVQGLQIGPADDFATDVPPLIERAARDRVRRYAELAAREGTPALGARDVPQDGWYCAPMVATGLPPDSDLLRDEIFGPLLAVEAVRDAEQACDRVDALPVALTGGLFSRNPRTVDRVVARSPVGNLYINRAITGAMVGRQPFGGNRLSGTGTKAGGRDYLLHFVQPRVVTENTVRHGLVV